MSSFSNGDFSVPEGYSEEEVESRLCYEDLDEDSELWLIRVPSDIQLSDLDRKKIYLGTDSTDVNVTNIKTENGKILDCCVENCEIQNMCVLLPEKNSKKLQVVRKVFKGAILVSEGLSLNEETEIKIENADDSQSVVIDESACSSHTSKRKKKSKTSHNIDVNYDEEIVDDANLPTRKFRKSSKCSEVTSESNEKTKIKTEPEFDSGDEFPFCTSQN